MVGQVALIAFDLVGVLFLCAFPFCWGRDCAVWQRTHGVRPSEAYLRGVTVPAIVLLAGYLLMPRFQSRSWTSGLLVLCVVASLVGVRWERHRYREPERPLRFFSEDDFPEGYDPLEGSAGSYSRAHE